jgi:RND family efflux transporter MFP subunit
MPRLVALAAALLLPACQGASPAASSETRERFLVATPQRGASIVRRYVARVEALRHIEVRARLGGVVEALEVDEGRSVTAGQVLYRVNARSARIEEERAAAVLASAEAEVGAAALELENSTSLAERGVVSPVELAQARAKLAVLTAKRDEARAAQRQAGINVELAVVRAPFPGVVGRLPIKVGSVVDSDALLTTLTNAEEVFAYIKTSEAEYLQLTKNGALNGRSVQLLLADGSPLPDPGIIDATDSAFDNEARSMTIRARFKNTAGQLRHGATGTLLLTDVASDALVIPQQATFERQDLVYVYTVDTGSVAHAQRIDPLFRTDSGFVVQGFPESMKIVVEGIQHIQDGDRIATREAG